MPDDRRLIETAVLAIAWRRARAVHRFRKDVAELAADAEAEAARAEVPANLQERIEAMLELVGAAS